MLDINFDAYVQCHCIRIILQTLNELNIIIFIRIQYCNFFSIRIKYCNFFLGESSIAIFFYTSVVQQIFHKRTNCYIIKLNNSINAIYKSLRKKNLLTIESYVCILLAPVSRVLNASRIKSTAIFFSSSMVSKQVWLKTYANI